MATPLGRTARIVGLVRPFVAGPKVWVLEARNEKEVGFGLIGPFGGEREG